MRGELGIRRPAGIAPGAAARRRVGQKWWLRLGDVPCLRTLRAVDDLELDRLAFFERPEAVATDRGVMHEHVTASLAFDESVTLGVVEPLDLACDAHRSSSLLAVRVLF